MVRVNTISNVPSNEQVVPCHGEVHCFLLFIAKRRLQRVWNRLVNLRTIEHVSTCCGTFRCVFCGVGRGCGVSLGLLLRHMPFLFCLELFCQLITQEIHL